ncbi:MAG: hypothetical protein ACJ76J_18120 [Thermoanaerobaculia bacterium]
MRASVKLSPVVFATCQAICSALSFLMLIAMTTPRRQYRILKEF